MDDATALARIERMTQANTYPVLAREELAELLELARRPDPAGRQPGEAGWVAVFDLNAAAAEGWRWKAGKVAGNESVNADGAAFAADAHKGCLAMAAQYDRAPKYDPDSPTGASYGTIGVTSPYARGVDPLTGVANAAEFVGPWT